MENTPDSARVQSETEERVSNAEAPQSGGGGGGSPGMAAQAPTVERTGQASAASDGMRLLERVVLLVHDKAGSDIHLLEGERPRVRLRGDLLPLDIKDHPLVTRNDIEDIMRFALTPDQKRIFEKHEDVDFSLDFHQATGRINVGYANGRRLHLVMRYLPANIIPIDGLGINPDMLRKIAAVESGLIMVAGETSSGKTTTIAALLDYINHNRLGSILTIENPVEYTLQSDKCLISRREIGRDTPDFFSALRASVRKNPDVLLIGEIRDHETASIALTAAETGIQTFCTLHAIGAVPAMTRLGNIMVTGGADEAEFRIRLANTLRAIISQQLVKSCDNTGLLPVYEILNVTHMEKNYILAADISRLEQSLEADHNISMGHCVYNLWQEKPRRIDNDTIKRIYGDQFNLMMNRLGDRAGWKPVTTRI